MGRAVAEDFRAISEISGRVHLGGIFYRDAGPVIPGDQRRYGAGASGGGDAAGDSGGNARDGWHGIVTGGVLSGTDHRTVAGRRGTGDEGGEDVRGFESPAGGAVGRSVRRAGDAFRAGRGGVLPRSAGAPAGGPSSTRRERRADLHQESESADSAGVSECHRRSHAEG